MTAFGDHWRGKTGRVKPEEDLAGISTNGARENSLKSESIFWWMHTTKTLTKKSPKNRWGKTESTDECSRQVSYLKNAAWTAILMLHLYNKLYGHFCCLHPPCDIKNKQWIYVSKKNLSTHGSRMVRELRKSNRADNTMVNEVCHHWSGCFLRGWDKP